MAAHRITFEPRRRNAKTSWWLDSTREGFTARAQQEAPRMLRNPEAGQVGGVYFEVVESMTKRQRAH